ncbi:MULTISPECIES: response regulator [unclassified Lentimicrobium]|uniref:response regulator n=1 Tax=unclassified Lentimicrobium TaxID=2677434 RepID=UPI001556476B|nr:MULTISPECIES: response regulator [unclassified Lentimicrobium]NPD44709.1 response regulator [Lentimicrobium sp. S6]NPD83435.1 response regulator [Lentimicrobium sp. L6]
MITNINVLAIFLIVLITILIVYLLFQYRKIKQLQEEKDQILKSVNSTKMEFWSSISHEIRTPMNGILGLVDLLKKTKLDKEQDEYLVDLNTSGSNLLTAVNSLLDRARLASDTIDLDEVPFNINDIVHGVAEYVQPEIKEKEIELVVYLEPGIPELMLGDPVRLKEILLNFVRNAVNYTVKGEIVIYVETESSQLDTVTLKFRVEDTGMGMSPVKQEALYNTVTKIDKKRFLDYNGPGLSLAVSKRMSELMGGEMGFKSEEGKGSNFWFTALFVKTTNKMAFSHSNSGITFSGLKAIVIEKHEISRKILKEYLQTLSIEVLAFTSTGEVIEYMENNKISDVFDLILLERHFQEVTDRMEIRRLKGMRPLNRAEIILISASANLYHKETLREAGYSGYLNKPIVLSHLANEIGAVIPAKYKKDILITSKGSKDSKLRILLVEDNLINEKVAKVSLDRIGHEVEVAREGKTAIAKYRVKDYDLILLDIKMPGMDGFEVATEIRNIEKNNPKKSEVRIIALTAEDFEGIKTKCYKVGMNGMLRKPFNFAELSNILKQ